ncbi:MAG: glycoside hydrolase family 3 C-terminal domain-containing protein [Spirochaetales bacterium]
MTHHERAKALVAQITLPEKAAQMRYNAPAIERLGVPAYNWWNECLHGVARAGAATVFPQAIALAASFDTPLMHRVATAISDEARAKYNQYKSLGDTLIYQGLTMWSPNINIFRDPRWGRGHETYGEDPFLTGEMGVAFVRGLQGDDPVHRKVDATLKHYAAHSGPENGRHGFNAEVSERDLRDTYLWAFQYVIDRADPSAVMGSYNRINGEAACASPTYLKQKLYGEFGFDGYVVSDCGALSDIHNHHHLTKSEAESAALAVNNGCQLNCGESFLWLLQAVEQGLVTEATLTEAVESLFTARFRLGMFDDNCVYNGVGYEVVESEAHTALNRQMAAESLVLLKNDGILPLKPTQTIAVIGPNADDKLVLLGNYNGTPSRYTTLLRGLQDATTAKVEYARGCHPFEAAPGSWAEQPQREAVLAARRADVVVLCLGLNPTMEGEEGDAYNGQLGGDKGDLEWPQVQRELFEAVRATGKPLVVVNVSGSCVNLTAADQKANAVVQCFYPGAEGGNALADVLFGKVSPSARLPVTFYRSIADLPPFEDYAMEGRTYRYFRGSPLYPFGHGLSYTTFRALANQRHGEVLTAQVTNTGKRDGATVIQVYETGAANDPEAPLRRLVGFAKVHLAAGESRSVDVALVAGAGRELEVRI